MTILIGIQPYAEPGAVLVTDSLINVRASATAPIEALLQSSGKIYDLRPARAAAAISALGYEWSYQGQHSECLPALADLFGQQVNNLLPHHWTLADGSTIQPSCDLLGAGFDELGGVPLVLLSTRQPPQIFTGGGAYVVAGGSSGWFASQPPPPYVATVAEARELALSLARQCVADTYSANGCRTLADWLDRGEIPGFAPPYQLAAIKPHGISMEMILE